MRDEDFWKAVQEKDFTSAGDTRTGALNLALLFGTAVIALALVLTPVLSAKTDKRMMANVPDEFDMISTGSIPSDGRKRYTVRRSVLQEMPGAVCIVNGTGGNNGC
ncbi:hypothetical protein KYK30_10320 [Shinella yambaruensis]|uniref:Transmembrane protein n=1 Tax=Shinella yambaruensis TaxID=415996 RepID=A0ABQ5ZAC7_9HYPH|nr:MULTISPECIES: hypothetical protein [Shinella]CAI0339807.1 conserved hypothetical protein [Rhizobiaceae bacterium]CAK7258198.1 Transmembrane protein [Shinella sp. WSC3-e]MCJ8028020.1 hypothetical protein [Shinella yambaruensis]MCO5140066.1 hypothetical protein [Shinella sp.]MCU7980090.1 hypothetical protein [Shinella yambaruensis]